MITYNRHNGLGQMFQEAQTILGSKKGLHFQMFYVCLENKAGNEQGNKQPKEKENKKPLRSNK